MTAVQVAVTTRRHTVRMTGIRHIAAALSCLWISAANSASLVQDAPGGACYYPAAKGYWGESLAEQRTRTKECLIHISYEIAAGSFPNKEPGLAAADYCQQAYTYEEEKLAAKEGRALDLDAARMRTAAFARPWVQQAIRLKCSPPSAR